MPTDDNKKSPSALVLPFGKHKGTTVAELLAKDPAYAEWVVNQGWVAERFAELHAAILSRGAVSDDSPEHNAIQVRFLDETFRLAFLLSCRAKAIAKWRAGVIEEATWEVREGIANIHKLIERAQFQLLNVPSEMNYILAPSGMRHLKVPLTEAEVSERQAAYQAKIQALDIDLARQNAARVEIECRKINIKSTVSFEVRGIDVLIEWGSIGCCSSNRKASVEIKPTMGDDFPSVMRQMERLGAGSLVLEEYTGRAVSEPQLRQMFEANGRSLVFVRDIEAEIANARAELAS